MFVVFSGCVETIVDSYVENYETDIIYEVDDALANYSHMDDVVARYFESAISVETTTHFGRTTHYIEPYQRENVYSKIAGFEPTGEIVVNGVIIDAPLVRSMHIGDGFRFVGYYNEDAVLVLMNYSEIMIPLLAIVEALGLDFVWYEQEQKIVIDNDFIIQVGDSSLYQIETSFTMPNQIAPRIVDDIVFVTGNMISQLGMLSSEPFEIQVFDGQVVIGSYSQNRFDGFSIGVARLTEERLRRYSSYVRFVDPSSFFGGNPSISIVPNITLRDFRWFHLGSYWGTPWYYYMRSELYAPGDITADRPFVVNWGHFGTNPQRGFSFLDDYNERRYFLLADNQSDWMGNEMGFAIIFEFTPGVSPQ